MKRFRSAMLAALAALAAAGCGASEADEEREAKLRSLLDLPDHLQVPAVPSYNPLTAEKIELGRHLFYDERLSGNETQSCNTCHLQEHAFTDAKKTPTGSTGDILARNSQGLANAFYNSTLTWASDGLLELEQQLHVPIRADNPIELGVTDAVRETVLARFDSDPEYQQLFAAAFPESDSGATINKVVYALASFCRSIITSDSPYDRFVAGEKSALTEQQKRGMGLFNGERFECFHCHNGINFSSSYRDFNTTEDTVQYPFFNNGLYNVDGEGSYPAHDQGLYDLTLNPNHRGMFRPQSLRNVALTAPYMHDGSIETLREVVEHYAAGGRRIEEGPFAGDGRVSPLKSGLVRGFQASPEEIDAVVAFLESLSDETLLTNPALASPFEK